jgi:hypothetical protein
LACDIIVCPVFSYAVSSCSVLSCVILHCPALSCIVTCCHVLTDIFCAVLRYLDSHRSVLFWGVFHIRGGLSLLEKIVCIKINSELEQNKLNYNKGFLYSVFNEPLLSTRNE